MFQEAFFGCAFGRLDNRYRWRRSYYRGFMFHNGNRCCNGCGWRSFGCNGLDFCHSFLRFFDFMLGRRLFCHGCRGWLRFSYNWLLGKTKIMTTELENFASSLADRIELESK